MGLINGLIVGIVGLVLAILINLIPDDSTNFVPFCWIPGVDCKKKFCNKKIYLFVILLTILIFLIPL